MYMLEDSCKLKQSFPSYLNKDIEIICEKNALKLSLIHDTGRFNVIVNNEGLCMPDRISLIEDNNLDKYTETQQHILYCYFTRHHDGFVREKYLKKIIKLNNDWMIPFVIKLLGEYVIEILDVIYQDLENIDVRLYKEFIEKNIDFYELTTQRVVSYWNCYYRWRYKYRKDYVGFKILDFINTKVLK